MRRWWKKVARLADNANFDDNDVASVFGQAVVRDFRKDIHEVIPFIMQELDKVEGELFPVDRAQPLADIERRMDGSPLRRLVADCLHEQLAAGLAGYRALANAIASSVKAWMQRAGHQMEEHYLRHPESSLSRAIDFRDRLAAAIQQVPVPDLVKKIIAPQSRRGSGPMQRRGLDEGVSFK